MSPTSYAQSSRRQPAYCPTLLLTTHSHIKRASKLSVRSGSQAVANSTIQGEGESIGVLHTVGGNAAHHLHLMAPSSCNRQKESNVQAVYTHPPSASHDFIDITLQDLYHNLL